MTLTTTRPILAPIICDGRLKDGRPCKRVFFDAYLAPGSIIEKRCDRCKKMNVREP